MITAQFIGDDVVLLKMQGRKDKAHGLLRDAIQTMAIAVQRRVKEKLSGEVLHNRTNTLRSNINQDVTESSGSIVAAVGTNVAYARRHEYGFHGTETVSAHIRRSRAQIAAATYTYKNKSGQLVTKIKQSGKYGKSTGEINVRSFTRHANTPERSFLRSTLREMAQTISNAMVAAVQKGMK
jgi:phage gpG-like protein